MSGAAGRRPRRGCSLARRSARPWPARSPPCWRTVPAAGPAATRRGLWPLRPCLVYLQIKDAVAATGEVVPAGMMTVSCGDAHGAGQLGFRGLLVARTAPGTGRTLRRLQRAGGVPPRRSGAEVTPRRHGGPLAMTGRPPPRPHSRASHATLPPCGAGWALRGGSATGRMACQTTTHPAGRRRSPASSPGLFAGLSRPLVMSAGSAW